MTSRILKAIYALARPYPRPQKLPQLPLIPAPNLSGYLNCSPLFLPEEQRIRYFQIEASEAARREARRLPLPPQLTFSVASNLSPFGGFIDVIPVSEEQEALEWVRYNREFDAHLKQLAEDVQVKAAHKRHRRRVWALLRKPSIPERLQPLQRRK